MHELTTTLLDSWHRIRPLLQADPAELQRRLTRRRQSICLRPPRAWCLAVRASDTRITPDNAHLTLQPDLDSEIHRRLSLYPPARAARCLPHDLTLTAPLLRILCRPVRIAPPGQDAQEVAAILGVHVETLRRAMKAGVFEVRRIRRLGGKRGRPVPVLYSPHVLDPSSANHWRKPDPLWGATWGCLADSLPDEFCQTLRRTPVSRPYHSNLRFRGHRWTCPLCSRQTRTVFYPFPRLSLPALSNSDLPASAADPVPAPNPIFACHHCHRIRYFTRLTADAWNQFVAHITAGLLFGHEVPKPSWFYLERKRQYRPCINRPPSPRRQQILHLLTTTNLTYAQIASRLGVGYATVHGHVRSLYAQHRIHSRKQLAASLNLLPQPPRPPEALALQCTIQSLHQ